MDRPPGDVRETYDRIATHFSETRAHPWPEVEAFVDRLDGVDVALDAGCGNGRHAELLAGRASRVIGLDASRGLLFEARDRLDGDGIDLLEGDAAALPIRDGRVDAALYVATIHHLPDRETRVRSLDELARVLAPGARALVSAWSTAHDRFDREEGFDTTVDWKLPGGERVPRFYHIYAPEEFEDDLEASALRAVEFEISSGNCYAEVRAER